jgi:type IV pilus assembly protein PilM
MAKSVAVWGIDIGRCALKALRCRLDGESVVADGFDYIEYPKLLTQPEADAPQLIKEALEQFLSRNTVKGDEVAISVSGESGLARYFKPPPVDVKKIADIVKYEARQQIPFALEDVIWDYQRMAGGQEVDGFALDTEIGLFAMKREAVAKAMAPYNAANIEIDTIQLAPIAIYNYIAHDVAKELPEGEEYSSESPPPSLVVLSIGTDTTDLVVTNGYRVWQRNIPLGGNHFTKQLSKELKLTFAKAEHLKRNPKQAEDPKAIFQAMRPVFADMVTEVQRSIGFFQSLDRKAKISSVVMLGNTVKLPGLIQYLAKHLGYEVQEIESFNKLGGSNVVTSPSFKDNVLAFSTCYGLCLQGLGKSKLSTNLLPREILTQRMIRAKKPWAIAGVAALVLACALNYTFWYQRWWEVNPEWQGSGSVKWNDAISRADSVKAESGKWQTEDTAKIGDLDRLTKIGREVVGSADRRVLWLEVMKAINKSLPPMKEGLDPKMPTPDVKTLPFEQRKDLKITYIETQFFPDLTTGWWNDKVKELYLNLNPELINAPPGDASGAPPPPPSPDAASAPVASPDAAGAPGGMPGGGGEGQVVDILPQSDLSSVSVAGPTGPGWVVELAGYHFYNDPKADRRDIGSGHVRNTLLKQLKEGIVNVPLGPGMPMAQFSMKDLGIGYAILAYSPPRAKGGIPNPNYVPPVGGAVGGGIAGPGAPGGLGGLGSAMPAAGGIPGAGATTAAIDPNNPEYFPVTRYDFAVQFVWQEKPLTERLKAIEQRKLEEAEKAKAAAAAAEAGAQPGQAPAGPPMPPSGVQPPQSAAEAVPQPAATVPQPGIATPLPPAVPAGVPSEEGAPPPGPPVPPNPPPAPVSPANSQGPGQ